MMTQSLICFKVMGLNYVTGVFLKCGVEVGVEKSIVNAPPDYNSDQLFKSNLTFCVVCDFILQFEKSMFFRRVIYS
jgi:hypothetical protein